MGSRSVGRALLALTLTAALLLAAAACGDSSSPSDSSSESAAASSDPLVIGFAAGLTGMGGDNFTLQGVEYEVDKLNAAGGAAGHPITLITKDMKSEPALAGTVTQELLDKGAQVIIGPAFPSLGASVIQTAGNAGVTVISALSTQPEYTVVGGMPAYLAAFGDNTQAAAAAEYALKQGYKTAFTLVSPDLSYTSATPEWFIEALQNGGGSQVGTANFSLGQTDFGPQVTQISNMSPQPDVIYTAAFGAEVLTFLRQLREANVDVPVIGADGNDTQVTITAGGKAAEGLVFTTHGYASPGSPYSDLIEGLTKKLGKPPETPGFSALGATAVDIIAAAVAKAGSTDPEAIGKAFAQLENVATPTGSVTYVGTGGVPIKAVALVKVENGEFVLADTITPSWVPEYGAQ